MTRRRLVFFDRAEAADRARRELEALGVPARRIRLIEGAAAREEGPSPARHASGHVSGRSTGAGRAAATDSAVAHPDATHPDATHADARRAAVVGTMFGGAVPGPGGMMEGAALAGALAGPDGDAGPTTVGELTALGLGPEHAEALARELDDGAALLSVRAPRRLRDSVDRLLERAGAAPIG